jgi:hypothetical protein
MVHGREMKLRSNWAAVLPEILAIKLLSIVDYELSGHAESANDLLPKEFPDSDWSDGSDRSRFNPLGEILNRNHSELEIALSHW